MTPYLDDGDVRLYHGDALETLQRLPNGSVDCVITSPPYWSLRDYRVEGQLGLEQTPDEYVTRMTTVFREVRRVLAGHGTCWVNMGDSYASNWPCNRRNLIGEGSLPNGKREARPPRMGDGLKDKDLVGMPWRLAFALQQPYYAGRIKDERDRIWLAAILDSEGCIHINRRKAGESAHSTFTKKDGTVSEYRRTQDTYGVMVSIDNTSEALIDRCHELIGQGSRYAHEAGTGQQQRKQTLYRLTLTGQQSRELLRELYPYLVAKQHEARIAYASPSSGEDAAQAHEAIKLLHNGGSTTVDAPAPPSLHEGGWFLRSDVIWSKKPNPMPESVTDRPTKAHEYVFLLTKRPRYWFDQEAVREPVTGNTHSRGTKMSPPKSLAHEDSAARVKNNRSFMEATWNSVSGRNIRSVWEIATQPYPEAHFATFPEELVRRCLLAGCPEWVCGVCGKPRERIVETEKVATPRYATSYADAHGPDGRDALRASLRTTTLGFTDCGHGAYRPGTVLDPFAGSGTTGLVARKHGRRAVLIELSEDYCRLASKRLAQLSLLAEQPS